MYKLLQKIFLLSHFLCYTYANSFRNRKLDNIVSDKIKCITLNNTCNCPKDCNILRNYSNCEINNCWDWDSKECIWTGPNYKSAIILQSIPFTGIFGAGFGNMGRWDLFSYGSIIWGVGSLIPCILLVIYICSYIQVDPIKVFKLYFLFFITTIIAYWVWGIYVISNKLIDGPKGCELIDR